jgi:hypothetical protein
MIGRIACLTFFIGALVWAYCNDWIILRMPSRTADLLTHVSDYSVQKKKCVLWYWHKNGWKQESVELIWTNNRVNDCHYVLNSWLTFLDDEKIMDCKVSIQTIIFSESGNELYISFDHAPFNQHAPLFEKWLWLEGLLKTLRENGIQSTGMKVYFLEHHQMIQDYHLDFTNPWPIEGFSKRNEIC